MKLNEWKSKELNRLLFEKFKLTEKTCDEVHPDKTHEQYLTEEKITESSCSATYMRDKEKK